MLSSTAHHLIMMGGSRDVSTDLACNAFSADQDMSKLVSIVLSVMPLRAGGSRASSSCASVADHESRWARISRGFSNAQ